ncbi:alternate-type signal peptide domain-containing protein [Cellulomonas xiejunii]|uniref:Alternate-type signal peptide domain-containing protein n=1 Tax=Cellulomonas xiejunii TaxID=2968083 RepID=A0ABY5KQD4_9CELL|nr:alternate-type signal peptide domain-containing protein [Cellulomonas xiejunii]MCC2321073.1 alternate-type signal peptide domain-containing protein [Cellulomonas xiejunii]UUI71666.1 alternate-type signal peptide domain-containing protein [Cellulomonas xiejunii]
MNKRTKALVAGGAGAVILLGTAGTFALWSDTETVPGAVVTGGKLALTAEQPGVEWKAYNIDTNAFIADEDNKIDLVAGVKLVGTTTITPELKGEYLKAELTTKTGEPVPTWLNVEWKVGDDVLTAATSAESPGSPSVVLTPATVGANETLTVSIRLADQDGDVDEAGDFDGADLTGESWSPENFTVTLKQLPPSQAQS